MELRDPRQGNVFVYMSKSKELVNRAMRYEGLSFEDRDHVKLGQALGYPHCCTESFSEGKHQLNYANLLINTANNTKDFSFCLNNLLKGTAYHLIPHFPCSFECKESIKYAKNLLEILWNVNPLFAREMECYLKLPVVHLNCKWVAFIGKVKKNGILYSDVHSSDEKLVLKLKSGNEVRLNKDAIEILKDGRHISHIKNSELNMIFKFN
jgi:hypothetical protein